MGFFTDDEIVLTDANDSEKAKGRKLHFRKTNITAYFRREDNPEHTNILTVDGRAFVVLENEETVADLMDG